MLAPLRTALLGAGLTPALDLDFAGTKSLDPRVTYSRGSAAMQVGPTGLVEWGPENLFLRSEEFENAGWLKTDVSVSANVAQSPDGNFTADLLTEGTGVSTQHRVAQFPTVISGVQHTTSVFVKRASGARHFGIIIAASGVVARVYFDLGAGTVATTVAGSGAIQAYPGGWYRCTAIGVSAATSATVYLQMCSGTTSGSETYTGDGSSGLYLWGAQLERYSSARAYIPTTSAAVYGPRFTHDPVSLASLGFLPEDSRTNLLTYSEEFDNTAWGKANATVSANAATSPAGVSGADLLVPNTVSAAHFVTTSSAINLTSGTTYALSVFAKAQGYSSLCMVLANGFGVNVFANFDLANGVANVVGGTAGVTVSIVAFPGGWYRCAVTAQATATTTTQPQIRAVDVYSTGDRSYPGNGTSGILIWGAQFEAGSFATSYIPTTTASATRAADVATMTGVNFSSWYNPQEGTFVVSLQNPPGSDYRQILQVDNGVNSDGRAPSLARHSNGTSARLDWFNGGVAQVSTLLVGALTTGSNIVATSYRIGEGASVAIKGLVLNPSVAITAPASSVLQIGQRAVANSILCAPIARIRYYRRRLSDQQLQALTAQ